MHRPKQAGAAFEAAEGEFSPVPAAEEEELRAAVLKELKSQGFSLAGSKSLRAVPGKDACRKLHEKSRAEQLARHRDLIRAGLKLAAPHMRSAGEIEPLKIDLELRRVSEGAPEHLLFRWWNLVWWSIPYQRPYGRQMRYLLWDGACLVEVEKALAYVVSCAAALGVGSEERSVLSSAFILPHVHQLGAVASGIMTMQEMILALEASREGYCLWDGSRISALISVHQFYSAMEHNREVLEDWRRNPDVEPGRTLMRFERASVQRRFYETPAVIGVHKLVATNRLVNEFAPELRGRIDDKTLAFLVLNEGEMFSPLPFVSGADLHLHSIDPQRSDAGRAARGLQFPGPLQLYHIYLKLNGTVLKLEVSEGFIRAGRMRELLSLLEQQLCAVDMLEPYIMVVTDRFVSEAAKIARLSLEEMLRNAVPDWAMGMSMPYRT